MMDFVSKWLPIVSLAATMSIVWVVLVPHGFPGSGLVWGLLLALAVAFWLSTRSTRSITQLLHDVEAEPRAVAAPGPIAAPAQKPVQ